MNKFYLIAFMILMPAALLAQGSKNDKSDCALADTLISHLREAGSYSSSGLVKSMECNITFEKEGYTIIKFDMSMTVNGEYRTRSSKSGLLSKEMVAALVNAPKGTKVYIQNIVGKDASGKAIKLDSKEFKL
jgi:hypothetical protein